MEAVIRETVEVVRTLHNTTNSDPNRVAEGNQEGETVEGGATIRGKVRDENKPRDTVNET